MSYRINEIFYSLQGEGVRAGTPNIFIRFSGCNKECRLEAGPKSPGGFDCDTEFVSGRTITLEEIAEWAAIAWESALNRPFESKDGLRSNAQWATPWLILTGGEPGLQLDTDFMDFWWSRQCKLAIETNGSVLLPSLNGRTLDWITLSPKVAEHAMKQLTAHELKYVRGYGQGIPKPAAQAEHYLISPAFDGMLVHPKTLKWCAQLCLENPLWRLSLQTHKLLQIR